MTLPLLAFTVQTLCPKCRPTIPCLPSPRWLDTCGAKGSCDPGFRTRPQPRPASTLEACDAGNAYGCTVPQLRGPLGNLVGDRRLCF